jgi:hypothetical protein
MINGKATIWGDGFLGLILASAVYERHEEIFDGSGETLKATCKMWRRGNPVPFIGTFGTANAKTANLGGKGTYLAWPREMFMWRARHRAGQAGFSDVTKGLIPREIAEDWPEPEAPKPPIVQPRRASAAPVAPQEPPITVDSRPIEEAPPPAPPEATKAPEGPAPSNGPENGGNASTGTGSAPALKSGSVEEMSEDEVRPALEGIIQSIADREGVAFGVVLDRIASFDGKNKQTGATERVTVRSLDMVFAKGTKWGRRIYHDAKKEWSKS